MTYGTAGSSAAAVSKGPHGDRPPFFRTFYGDCAFIPAMRLLLIEDDADVRSATASFLRTSGFAVDEAADGEQGAKLGLMNAYDAVVSDLVMPKMDGKAVCAALRKAGKRMPILLLSVQQDASTKVDLLDAGADDYLCKPYDGAELVARIRALCRRPPQSIPCGALSAGDLELDPSARTVHLKKKPIDLRPREFNLLEYFLRNIGQVLTRPQILAHVWDINADPFSNTIEVHIAALRRKLGHDRIKTVSGARYRLEGKRS